MANEGLAGIAREPDERARGRTLLDAETMTRRSLKEWRGVVLGSNPDGPPDMFKEHERFSDPSRNVQFISFGQQDFGLPDNGRRKEWLRSTLKLAHPHVVALSTDLLEFKRTFPFENAIKVTVQFNVWNDGAQQTVNPERNYVFTRRGPFITENALTHGADSMADNEAKTQKTAKGYEIPVPTRGDFDKTLSKVTTPEKKLKRGSKKK